MAGLCAKQETAQRGQPAHLFILQGQKWKRRYVEAFLAFVDVNVVLFFSFSLLDVLYAVQDQLVHVCMRHQALHVLQLSSREMSAANSSPCDE